MSSVKVILTDDVASLGFAGDVVNVKPGYARNFLLPQKKAMMADPKNLKVMEHARFLAQHKMKKIKSEAEAVAAKMAEVSLNIAHKVGEEGKLFGSVTSIEIEKALRGEGFEVDKRNILLEKPIKELGEFAVPVKLHPEVTQDVKVAVVAEEA